jgi:hypothetical protein
MKNAPIMKQGNTDHLRQDLYGKKNRPQTPVKGIIWGNYGNDAATEITDKYN